MHTKGQVIEFLEQVFGNSKLSNGGLNMSVVCPVCSSTTNNVTKQKLVIRTDNFLAHCWVCGYKTKNIYYLILKYHPEMASGFLENFNGGKQLLTIEDTETTKNHLQQETKISLPYDFIFLAEHLDTFEDEPWFVRQAINYLLGRDITRRDMWYYGFGVSQQKELRNRVIIPSFDENGDLNYYSARTWKRNVRPTYYNLNTSKYDFIFNEHHIDWNRPLTIVEGIFDLTKANENATCLLGSSITSKHKLFQTIVKYKTTIVLALDPDAVNKTYNIANMFYSYGIDTIILHIPTTYKDVGEMKKEVFVELLETNTKKYRPEDYWYNKLKGNNNNAYFASI